jgi:SAM-dependent methyltransferase
MNSDLDWKTRRIDSTFFGWFLWKLDIFIRKISIHIPFAKSHIIASACRLYGNRILDVGCGIGETISRIKENLTYYENYYILGVDIFIQYLEQCRTSGNHNDLILCDVRNLPIKSKSFDVVICLDVLEHLHDREAMALIKSMENIARKAIIIAIPVGAYVQAGFDNNPYQEHKSYWSPREMRALGFTVRGCGLRGAGGDEGWVNQLPKILAPIQHAWILVAPLVYYFPSLADSMVCVKTMIPKNDSNYSLHA